MTALENIQNLVRSHRQINVDSRRFLPQNAVEKISTEANVMAVLSECKVPDYQVKELSRNIVESARRIFLVLVLIDTPTAISRVVQYDQFGESADHLDSKLPFTIEELRKIFGEGTLADKFAENQWELAIPTFTKRSMPRVLDKQTILPILNVEFKGQGGFGEVSRISLHPSHLRMDGIHYEKVVQKSFSTYSKAKEDYEKELRNLSILNVLKHPNIVGLLGAYTYQDRHHLLFPYAEDGSLQSMLKGETQPPGFEAHVNFFQALFHLSHALQQVHDLTFHELDLRLIGCHHDIKPANILVHEGTFLLADFGLSNFKATFHGSSTPHLMGQGDYLAPECEDLDDEEFKKHIIHRSSDMWSFGCIIVEVLTFMLEGRDGVEHFRSKRKFKQLGHFTFYTFHKGKEMLNEAVMAQLDQLKTKMTSAEGLVVNLAEKLLSLDPNLRPKSKQVTRHFMAVTILVAARPVQRLFERLIESSSLAETFIESTRLNTWLDIWSATIGETESLNTPEDFEVDLKAVMETISLLRTHVESALSLQSDERQYLSLPSIRHLNTRLQKSLPLHLQSQIRNRLQTALLNLRSGLPVGPGTAIGAADDKDGKLVQLLLSIKDMTTILDQRTLLKKPDLEIESWRIKSIYPISTDCEIAHLKTDPSHRLIVEWIHYDVSLQDEGIGQQRHVRAETRAEIFSEAGKMDELRVLRCFKYCHDSENERFGLAFSFPLGAPLPCEPLTLRQMLDGTKAWEQCPSLDAQFALALDLVSSFLGYHRVGWLHRSVNSSNVVFFPSHRRDALTVMHEPFIIGFNHSRPDDSLGFTDGPRDGGDDRDYQHPTYLARPTRYRLTFEYYSLGLVLLEIGLWKSLKRLTIEWKGTDREDFRRWILSERLFMLKHRTGTRYHEVVRRCLRCDWDEPSPTDEEEEKDEEPQANKEALKAAFDKHVVCALQQCRVSAEAKTL